MGNHASEINSTLANKEIHPAISQKQQALTNSEMTKETIESSQSIRYSNTELYSSLDMNIETLQEVIS